MNSPPTYEEEVHFLNVTLLRLESEIKNLRAIQSKLRRRLNELSASTNCLPPETLASIFVAYSAHSSKGVSSYHPLFLGSICSQWRQVVNTTPALWTTLALEMPKNEAYGYEYMLPMTEAYLTRAGALPITVKLSIQEKEHVDMPYQPPWAISPEHKKHIPTAEIFDLIFTKYPQKLGRLIINNIPPRWWSLLCRNSTLPFPSFRNLEEISLAYSRLPAGPTLRLFNSSSAARLSRVKLSGYEPTELPWKQITHLEVDGMSKAHCLNLLVRCPNLVDYRCHKPNGSSLNFQGGNSLMQGASERPLLRSLTWEFGLVEMDMVLLTHARFPSLQYLDYRRHFMYDGRTISQPSYRQALIHFVSSLRNLTVFKASLRSWTGDELREALPSTIQELHLTDGVHRRDRENVLDLFRHLIIPDDTTHATFLPHLKLFSLVGGDFVTGRPMVGVLLKMLQSRREGVAEKWETHTPLECLRVPGGRKSLYLTYHIESSFSSFQEPEWKGYQVAHLQQLVSEGLRVELISADGTTMEWQ